LVQVTSSILELGLVLTQVLGQAKAHQQTLPLAAVKVMVVN